MAGTASLVMLVNRAAGGAEQERVGAARSALASSAPVELAVTAEPAEVDEVVAALEGRTLVVCGGDGSLSLAVGRLRAAGILDEATLGLVPLGTGNDLARALSIPDDPVEAAEVVLGGTPRTLDLLVDEDGGSVVNAAHAGVGAEASERSRPLKDLLGDLAYPAGAAAAGLTADGWGLDVFCDGRQITDHDTPLLMVAVANGPTIGGGTSICPEARPDDGRLDLMMCAATGAVERAAFGRALVEASHGDRADVVLLRGRQVRVCGEPVRWAADGELTAESRSRTWTVEPACWRLLTPG